jgi:hypothetical protein
VAILPAKLQKFNMMKTKDKQDEAQRHAQRNYVVKEVRNQLVSYLGYSYTNADIFIGKIWGLGERKIREIVRSESFLAVSADDLSKLAVILQRISKESDKRK